MKCRRLLVSLLIVPLAVLPGPWSMHAAAASNARDSRPDGAQKPVADASGQARMYRAGLDRIAALLGDLRKGLDRTAFDFDALLESLDHDAARIIEFSKRDIAFEQYPGVLRGPLGTLFSRAGNSIDQSMLLAKLLRDAGYDARIASVRLDDSKARAVLQAMGQPVAPPPPVGNASELVDTLVRHGIVEPAAGTKIKASRAADARNPAEAMGAGIYESVLAATRFIRSTLEENKVSIGGVSDGGELVREARDYHWVQYKDGAAGAWQDVHPVFAGNLPFAQPRPTGFFVSEVPQELAHRLRFQVFIERKVGSRLQVLPVTKAWERPVANLVGVPMTFTNIADSMLGTTSLDQDLEQTIDVARSFVPAFGAGVAEGAQFFDLRGTLVDPIAAGSQASGLFAAINRSFSEAIGGVADKAALPTLTAQWLEFTLISPDGNERKFRRATFDRIGAAARASGKVPASLAPASQEDLRALLQRHTFVVAPGAIPRGFVVEKAAEHFERSRPMLDALLDNSMSAAGRPRAMRDLPTGWAGYAAVISLMDMAKTLSPDRRIYRSGPSLLIHRRGPGSAADAEEAIDIVSNPRRAIDTSAPVPSLDPEYAMRAGVWETAVEGALIRGPSSFSTWLAFQSADKGGIAPAVLVPGKPIEGLEVSGDSLEAIRGDLANGYAVIVPRKEGSTGRSGWWRVNLRTGETLGQAGDGRGTALTEWEAAGLAVSMGFLAFSMYQCMPPRSEWKPSKYGRHIENEEMCCYASNAGFTFATAMIGIWLLPAALAKALPSVSDGAKGFAAGVGMDGSGLLLPADKICRAAFGGG